MTTKEFQDKHGPEWAKFVQSEMWRDAKETAESRTSTLRTQGIPEERLKEHAPTILARQQGWIELRTLLDSLAELKTFDFKNVLKESYLPDIPESPK